jgi:hypothetical protein
MKQLLLLFACSGIISVTAQNTVNITPQQYENLKQHGQLDLTKKYVFLGDSGPHQRVKPSLQALSSRSQSSICSCLITLDSSFSVVPFIGGDTASGYRNDDASTSSIALPFTFNFYGVNYDSLYINNNGNISFISPYITFTPDSFPSANFNMIAPFWGDVDTRDSASGLVYYKITPTAMIIKWDNVGYYASHSDKKNTFQLIITNGSDPLLPAGDNVSFCYGDMQWTTGDASSGTNGFGGTPATAGVNIGNGADYFQVGRFDGAGTAFDGPYNHTDSVDFLDNQGMYFNVASIGNIPPIIINNNICDTIDVYTGDTTRSISIDSVIFKLAVSTPEINQVVNATITCNEQGHFSYVMSKNTPTYKEYTCTFVAKNLAESLYNVTIVATDNGTPAAQSTRTIVIKNHFDATLAGIKENALSSVTVYPNPTDGIINVQHNFSPASNPMLSLVNVMGESVLTAPLSNQQQTVDISGLSKGIYFATVTCKEGKSKTFKLVRK